MNPDEPNVNRTPVAQLKDNIERRIQIIQGMISIQREAQQRTEKILIAHNAELAGMLDAQAFIRKAFPDAK